VTPTAPIRPVSPGGGGSAAKGKAQGFVFNFDNADLYEVIRTIAEVLKMSYVIDPKVKGVVNIHVTGPVAQEDIYPIFLSLLRMNGATVVKKDSLYEIVPWGEGKKLPAPLDTRTPEDRFAIEVIKPRYIPIGELEKLIKPFLSDEKEVIPFAQNNILIVSDLASNIRKIRDILSLFDIDIFTDMTIRIYPVSNSDATELAKDLEKIFSSFGISSKEAKGGGITFNPIVRSNSIMVVSSMPGILDKVENWIKELDKAPTDESKTGVFIHYVQNAKAKDLADVLKQVYTKGGKETGKKPEEPKRETTPTTPGRTTTQQPRPGETPRPTPTPAPATPAARGDEAGKVTEGEINIVVDEPNNALVIRALYRDYKAVMETIKKLDLYPKQVLIEVMLAEITLDDENKFGIEWFQFVDSLAKGRYQQAVTTISNPLDPTKTAMTGDIRYSIIDAAGKFSAAISAAASDNRLNIISSPHIIASNNKEAKIQIGKEQPILTSTYTGGLDTGTTGTSNVITGSIEYKDIGIIITLTPRISDSGLISLEIQVEKSDVDLKALGNLTSVPVFTKTMAKTVLSVLDGQMIVIGGLIEDQKNVIRSGVPFLYKIPIIGGLFGSQQYINKKEELMILMTPHIITDYIQSKAVTDEFRQKVEGIRREFEQRERSKKR